MSFMRFLLIAGILYWLWGAIPFLVGTAIAVIFIFGVGLWMDKPRRLQPPSYPLEPPNINGTEWRRYPDMSIAWNMAVHEYMSDEISSFELVKRAS